ncbi:hypothetical protein [Vibrio marisflavi]|uniref:Uncharacterized protein n=1 Tax=Vibrio marisflavi CECT 7928 TaxID=634439 RepID=A0ABN8E7L4_9VIBR|nr:hypothetical protein [Vibrio marisflavi]CAH0540520.1 hypothetical protein VMF7928_02920 [Vibrio marisflavi CECT 7928]
MTRNPFQEVFYRIIKRAQLDRIPLWVWGALFFTNLIYLVFQQVHGDEFYAQVVVTAVIVFMGVSYDEYKKREPYLFKKR